MMVRVALAVVPGSLSLSVPVRPSGEVSNHLRFEALMERARQKEAPCRFDC